MICMYLPPQGQDGVECRFIVDNMKDKTEKDGKYNNDDERLSRDLKKHNWLMNKLKERFDVSDTTVPDKSTTPTEDKEAKKPLRVGRRRHSIAIPSAKCKSIQSGEEESNKESQKEINVYSDCEVIDYSLKKTTKDMINDNEQKSPVSFNSDHVIYDLSKTKRTQGMHDQKNESQSQKENIDLASSDMVYDLSRNKKTSSEKVFQSHNVIHIDNEEPVKYLPHCSYPNLDSYSFNIPRASISDLRKMRRVDTHNISDLHKKNAFTINVDDSSEQDQDQQIIKHNLPFGVVHRKEKNIGKQSPGIKDNQKVDISVQTEEIFTVSKGDWNLLNFIKSKGITEDKIRRCTNQNNENCDSPGCHNLSDVDSDSENGVINIHILRKLLEQSEKNKNILNKTYNICNKSQSNGDPHEPEIKKYNNEKQKEITKVFDILMSEYDQRLINGKRQSEYDQRLINDKRQSEHDQRLIHDKRQSEYDQRLLHDKRQLARESDIWNAKRKKIHNPIAIHSENIFEFDQNKSTESANVSPSKNRTFVPQKPEPTRPQIYHYPLSWSRQSVSPYEAQNIFQLPYKYHHNFASIEALNRKASAVYDHRIREYPQIPQRLEHCTPRRLSPYTSQQINYLEMPRTESKVHYGPVQQNNQYINIRGAESPNRSHALHPTWCGENRIHLKSQRASNGRHTRQEEDLFQESRFRKTEAQKIAWESEITNYPNTDWSGTK